MICKICHKEFKALTNSHLVKHDLIPKEYEQMFGCKTVPEEWCVGKNNPFYGKNHTENSKVKSSEYRNAVSSRISGKTYEELYGIDTATKVKKIRSDRWMGENNPMYDIEPSEHPNWKGGWINFPYPFEFNMKLRRKIREREDYCCLVCKSNEKDLGKSLDIHHIDYNVNNNNEFNLVALCRCCHVETKYGNKNYWNYFFSVLVGLRYGNQQPSLSRNTFEGSETNSRFLTGLTEEGNGDTSAVRP